VRFVGFGQREINDEIGGGSDLAAISQVCPALAA
jgi:hypothetical protein